MRKEKVATNKVIIQVDECTATKHNTVL